MLASVILAAGESRRMGSPKATLPMFTAEATPGKVTFLDHLVTLAHHPRVGMLRVVLGAHADKILRRVPLKPEWVVENPNWKQGQLSSIQAALRSLPPGQTDGIILFLVDHPLISHSVVDQLISAFYSAKAPLVIPTYRGRRGHPVVFSSNLYEELLSAPADTGARAVVWAHKDEVLEMETNEEGVVFNLNDPDSLRDALGDTAQAKNA
jgi:molybdenum cofactor cytidylyltransferase